MKASGRSSTARFLRWAALALLIAATPFCWLVIRDTILVLRAGEGSGGEAARWLLVNRLADTIDYSRASAKTGLSLAMTMSFDPNCFVMDGGKLRPSQTPAEQSSFRDGRQPSVEEILLTYQMFTEHMVERNIRLSAISDSFSTSELILFNACISATPFGGACEEQASARIEAIHEQTAKRLYTLYGTKAGRSDSAGYCSTLPLIIGPEG